MTRLAIIGSRDLIWTPESFHQIDKDIDSIGYSPPMTVLEIVSGGASGADAMAEAYAKYRGLQFTCFSADWNKYGKSGGPRRNTQIAIYSNFCLAYINKPLNQSIGTKDCIKKFKDFGKKFIIREWIDDYESQA